ncbi:MAG: cytochrome-c peroxidase, partial [Gemmatimonadales bacterium]
MARIAESSSTARTCFTTISLPRIRAPPLALAGRPRLNRRPGHTVINTAHPLEAPSVASDALQQTPRRPAAVVCLLLAAALLSGPTAGDERSAPTTAARTGEPITPIPTAADLDPDKVRLGERLFHDPRLSRDNGRSCASCHRLEDGGDDDRAIAMGADGRPLDFNSPTIFNV